jgi:hypothetical protein
MSIRGPKARLLTILLVSYGLACCGTKVPDIKEVWDRDIPEDKSTNRPKIPAAAQIEFAIKRQVYCDLKDAVRTAQNIPVQRGPNIKQKGLIPENWGAQVSLTLQVDGVSELNPGVTAINPLRGAEVFNLNLGGTLSSTATRTDKFDPYWTIAHLMLADTPRSVCSEGNEDPFGAYGVRTAKSSPLIRSDLGIKDWLVGAMAVNLALNPPGNEGIEAEHKKDDAVTYEIKFVIVSSGEVTPIWKLLRVTANNRVPFFKTGRTRSHDLIITIGPQTSQTDNTHLASQIGNAVSNANQAAFSRRGFGF